MRKRGFCMPNIKLFIIILVAYGFIFALGIKDGKLNFYEASSLLLVTIIIITNMVHVNLIEKKTKLSIKFDPNDKAFITYTRVPWENELRDSRWIRLKIENNGDYFAKRCHGLLEEVKNSKGDVLYDCSPVFLHWSSLPLEMPYMDMKGYLYIDIVCTVADIPHFFIANTYGNVKRGIRDELPEGIYTFTIRIYSENADPESVKLEIKWGGKWDEIEAEVVESEGGNT